MKFLFLTLFFGFSFVSFSQTNVSCGEIPALNKKILETLKPYNGKKIARGECWDAAQLALNTAGADWDGYYDFGRKIDTAKECIQPGDIVQFENVQVEVKNDKVIMKEEYPHHTAIVSKVDGNKIQLFHQNTGYTGRKMGYSDLDLVTVKKGKMTFYRPIPKG